MPPVKKAEIPEAKPIRVKQDRLFYYVDTGPSRYEVVFNLVNKGVFDARIVNHHIGALVLFVSKDGKRFQLYHRFNNTTKWLLDMNLGLLPSPFAAMSEQDRKDLRIYIAQVPRLVARPSVSKFIFALKCQLAGEEFERSFNPQERAKTIYLFRHQRTGTHFVWTSIRNSTQVLQERVKLLQGHSRSHGKTTAPDLRDFCKTNAQWLVCDCFQLVASETCMPQDDVKKKVIDLLKRFKIHHWQAFGAVEAH